MTNNRNFRPDELYHYGVKGMRWKKTGGGDPEIDGPHSRKRHDSGNSTEVHRRENDGPHSRKRHSGGESASVARRKTLKGFGAGAKIIFSRKPGKKLAGTSIFAKRK